MEKENRKVIKIIGGNPEPFDMSHFASIENKICEKVRKTINKWIKKQATYQGLMGCGNNGFIVTESQMKKLKRDLCRQINFLESNNGKKDG